MRVGETFVELGAGSSLWRVVVVVCRFEKCRRSLFSLLSSLKNVRVVVLIIVYNMTYIVSMCV